MTSNPDNVVASDRGQRARTVRRVGSNAISLLACDVVNRAATFVLYALVARYGGAHEFGQLSLGLTFVYTLQVMAAIGLPTLIVRDVAKRPETAGRYFMNGTAIGVVSALICYAMLAGGLMVSGYAADTSRVILLLGLSAIPWALSMITEAVFRAREQMHFILIASLPVNLIKVPVAYLLLSNGWSVTAVAVVIVASHTAILLVEWVVLWFLLDSMFTRVELSFCRDLIRGSWRFFGIDAFIALWTCIDVLLLSWFYDEAAVGAFAAAVQLLLPPRMALQAFVNSLFPLMCANAEQGDGKSRALVLVVIQLLMVVTLPGCVLLWFGARPLISLIYSAGFGDSVIALKIMVPTLLLYAATRILGQLLMSYGREGRNLRIIVIDVIFNFTCGLVLTSQFGVIGAATTVLLTQTLDCWLHLMSTRELVSWDFRSESGRPVVIWQTLIASAAMAAVVAVSGNVPFVLSASLGLVVFAVMLTAMYCIACGGVGVLREQILTSVLEK